MDMVKKGWIPPSEVVLELQRDAVHCEHQYFRRSIALLANKSMKSQCSTQSPDSTDGVSIATNSIAWFTPRHMSRGSQAPTTLYQLQVTPRGRNQMLFDDIVMSILAIQRRILRPTAYDVPGLFNDCTPGF
jgi:hypothetical protein